MRSWLLVPVAVTSIALFHASPARPCSIAIGLTGDVAPDSGAVDVPTNAVLLLGSAGGQPPLIARLEQGDAEPVSLDVSFDADIVVVGLPQLEPETSYSVVIEPSFEGEVVPDPVSFTTGGGDDTSPPSIAGQPTVTVEHHSPGLFGVVTDCGSGASTNGIIIEVQQADDDVGVAAFRLFRLLDNGARQLRGVFLAGAGVTSLIDSEEEPGQYRYAVVAVDFAGNESEPSEVIVDVSGFGCSATPRTSSPGVAALFGLFALALGAGRAGRARHSMRRASKPTVVE